MIIFIAMSTHACLGHYKVVVRFLWTKESHMTLVRVGGRARRLM